MACTGVLEFILQYSRRKPVGTLLYTGTEIVYHIVLYLGVRIHGASPVQLYPVLVHCTGVHFLA
jgi:hypothetical protein